MDDFDDADLDGDGEFDAIDLEILEGSNSQNQSNSSNTGCCVPLILAGVTISGASVIWARLIS